MSQLDKYNFHYNLRGNHQNKPLLFLHGFIGNSQDFNDVINLLSEEFYCLAVDLPGHGKTRVFGDEDCYTMSVTASALIELLDSLKIPKCGLIGYSMGGRLALYLALNFPSRFSEVVLESTSPGLKTEAARLTRLQSDLNLAKELELIDFQQFLIKWYQQPIFQSLQSHRNFETLIEKRRENNPVELAKSLRNMGTGKQPSLWDKLSHNKIPILLLVGEYDDKFRSINEEMMSLSPIAKLQIIPKSGHNIHWKNMIEYVKSIRNFCLCDNLSRKSEICDPNVLPLLRRDQKMRYKFDFRPYQRPFKQPLQTSHGVWAIREGIIIRLTDEMGNFRLGEIAPISWFGSESLADALIFCQQLSGFITEETIFSIPNELPACQFAFESALASFPPPNPPLEGGGNNLDNLPLPRGGNNLDNLPLPREGNNLGIRDCHLYCGLLPAGETALKTWETLWNEGYRTFKWKITSNLESELRIFERLIDAMRQRNEPVFLRLDANGGLSYTEACQWLEVCDRVSALIEFLEQPLPVSQFKEMQKLRDRGTISIALDESVATLTQIKDCYQRGWRGIFVIKPSLMGSPSQLREFCYNNPIDAVFSSVFETDIGRQAALKLAADIASHTRRDRVLGFGVNHWFNDNELLLLENLWKTK